MHVLQCILYYPSISSNYGIIDHILFLFAPLFLLAKIIKSDLGHLT